MRQPRQSRWSRWFVVLPLAAIGTLLLAGLLAGVGCKLMWGFWFSRPGPDERAAHAAAAVTVTHFEVVAGPNGEPQFGNPKPYEGPGWWEELSAYAEADYYLLDRRVLLELEDANRLTTPMPMMTDERLAGLIDLVKNCGHLARNSPGYDQFTVKYGRAGGTAYELVGQDGSPLLLVAFRGSDVSNDHLPYYELLYSNQPESPPQLLSVRRFFFDIAGMEHFEFVAMFTSFSILGLVIVMPLTGGLLAYRRFSSASAIKRGLCPRCRYDLGGNHTAGCSECGWGRGETAAKDLDLRRYGMWAFLKRRLTSAPGTITLAAAVLGVGLYWWGHSTPGRDPQWMGWGALLGLAAALVFAAKLLSCLIARRTAFRRWGIVRFGIPVMLAVVTPTALEREWPLRARFALSRAALDRAVQQHQNGVPFTGPKRVGFYTAYNVFNLGPGISVLVPGMNLKYANGFIFFPDGRPKNPTAFGKSLDCIPLGDGWYIWEYVE